MVIFALKGKEKGLKGKETQVNKGRVQDICDSLTQVNKGRVQDICDALTQVKEGRVKGIYKLLTQVNKGRVQVRVVARVNKDRVHTTTSKTSFKKLGGSKKDKSSFTTKENGRRNPENQFFQSEFELKDRIQRNTSFRAEENDPGNQFSKSYGRNRELTYGELHVTTASERLGKSVFQVGLVRKVLESK